MITYSGCAIGGSCSDDSGIIFLIVLGIIACLTIAYIVYKMVNKGKENKK